MAIKFVYMLLCDINEVDNAVVKIGRTNDFDRKRKKFNEKFKTVAVIPVSNDKFVEKMLLFEFRFKFFTRWDIGRKYFEGNFNNMLLYFNDIVIKLSTEDSDSEYELTN